MNHFNGFPEFTIKDYDTAIEYLFDGNKNIIDKFNTLYKNNPKFIIESANVKLVECSFFKYYAPQIITHLQLLGERPRLIRVDNNQFNWFAVGCDYILKEAKNKGIDKNNVLMQYSTVDMNFPIIKLQDTVDVMKRIIGDSELKEEDNIILQKGFPFTFRILPSTTHKTLNNLVRLIYKYT